jgi:signal transduction histidine kinase/DNA-binding response OmpR family regulator/HPt (histidine-containing phosphotransfer) domain-containing protein
MLNLIAEGSAVTIASACTAATLVYCALADRALLIGSAALVGVAAMATLAGISGLSLAILVSLAAVILAVSRPTPLRLSIAALACLLIGASAAGIWWAAAHPWLMLATAGASLVVAAHALARVVSARPLHRRLVMMSGAIAVLVLVAGGFASHAMGRWAEMRDRTGLETLARSLAASIDAEMVAGLSGTADDLRNPAWGRLHRQLAEIRSSLPEARYVYLMRLQPDGRVAFLVDSEDTASRTFSAPGDIYAEAASQPETLEPLRQSTVNTQGPITDSFGTWISANASLPLPDGRIAGSFSMDFPAVDWSQRWRGQRLLGMITVTVLMALIAAATIALWRERDRIALLRRRQRLEQAIADACHELLTDADTEAALERILPAIGAAAGVDRTRLVRFAPTDDFAPVRTWRSTHAADERSDRIDVEAVRSMLGKGSDALLLRPDAAGDTAVCTALAPIPAPGGTWGALVLENRGERRAWDEGELAALRTLGSAIGGSLARHTAEQELRRAKDAAERASEAKADFLSTMSHEFRTPLGGILGMNALLLESRLDGEQREHAHTVQTCAEGLLGIVDDILDFSKIEAGRLEIEHIPYNPREVVEDALAALVPRARERAVDLACAFSAAVPARLNGDPARLRQVLLNLVGNGVKFAERGEVVVRCDCTGDGDGLVMQFTVSDTGCGIPADLQARLFTPFAQADAATARRHGGTGLGLAISKRLVELMGGVIILESSGPGGSTFRFSVRAGSVTPPPPRAFSGERALVVEPRLTIATTLVDQLNAFGLRAEACPDLDAAIAACRGPQLRAVLLSSALAEGAAAARSIARACLPTKPLILLTVPVGRGGGADDLAGGAVAAVLPSPVRPSRLALALAGSDDPRATWSTPATPSAVRLRGRALVAEDNEANAKLLSALLARSGMSADIVTNGVEAVAATARTIYDIVVMDIEMPEMDGLTASRLIRSREGGGSRLPIIAVTANAFRHDRDRALSAGMDEHLRKPVEPEILLATVQRLLTMRPVQAAPAPPVDPFAGTGTGRVEKPTTRQIAGGVPLDNDVLDQLQRHLGPDGLTGLIAEYDYRADQEFGELYAALAGSDPERIRLLAHRLGSGAGSLGLIRLMAALRTLERSARAGDMTDGARDRIAGELERGRIALRDYRDSLRQSRRPATRG